jgi:hypothetical protein
MSGMRYMSDMDPRTLSIIGAACCGPFNGVWDPKRSYWICDYHCGYNDGLEACRETEPS